MPGRGSFVPALASACLLWPGSGQGVSRRARSGPQHVSARSALASKPCHRRATREPRESPHVAISGFSAQGARCQSLKSLHCQRVYNNHHALHHPVQRSGCEPMSGTRMAIKTPNNTAVAILRAFEAPSDCACVDTERSEQHTKQRSASESEGYKIVQRSACLHLRIKFRRSNARLELLAL